MEEPQPDWSTWTGDSMVRINNHCLFTSASGPPRTPSDPLVVIVAGAGDVTSSYTALAPLVAKFARILLYDRSGLGRSEPGRPDGSPIIAAKELHRLLHTMQLSPPLLLAGHSYGGIVAREYLHLYPGDVAGMVLLDSATERQSDYFRVPDLRISAVQGDLNFAQVTGLRADTVLSRDEWRVRAIDMARGAEAAQAEANSFVSACRSLAGKKQLDGQAMGSRPVSVIRCNSARDYERIYQRGVEVGNGSVQQQKEFRELLDRWPRIDQDLQEDQLRLSSFTRLVHLPDCGHNVHLVRPDVVAGEIHWVLKQLGPHAVQKL
ncbi:alpha/beta hydrolase fold protein [Penicillium verhagenii]|uniref:alpha/beta hydrolase fold protein n=1 Tax=Penicillium verhagenii TaxID=1562060 RepID=UPI0025451F8E|nr:alpha/beta hydrolase fold protein [Penicillium verhagenii]KAJ5915714.1 alpha/beta hydrolase fold protein [Penicillium verhagenii]